MYFDLFNNIEISHISACMESNRIKTLLFEIWLEHNQRNLSVPWLDPMGSACLLPSCYFLSKSFAKNSIQYMLLNWSMFFSYLTLNSLVLYFQVLSFISCILRIRLKSQSTKIRVFFKP